MWLNLSRLPSPLRSIYWASTVCQALLSYQAHSRRLEDTSHPAYCNSVMKTLSLLPPVAWPAGVLVWPTLQVLFHFPETKLKFKFKIVCIKIWFVSFKWESLTILSTPSPPQELDGTEWAPLGGSPFPLGLTTIPTKPLLSLDAYLAPRGICLAALGQIQKERTRIIKNAKLVQTPEEGEIFLNKMVTMTIALLYP